MQHNLWLIALLPSLVIFIFSFVRFSVLPLIAKRAKIKENRLNELVKERRDWELMLSQQLVEQKSLKIEQQQKLLNSVAATFYKFVPYLENREDLTKYIDNLEEGRYVHGEFEFTPIILGGIDHK